MLKDIVKNNDFDNIPINSPEYLKRFQRSFNPSFAAYNGKHTVLSSALLYSGKLISSFKPVPLTLGSYPSGSFRAGSYIIGSYNRSSFTAGSYRSSLCSSILLCNSRLLPLKCLGYGIDLI